MKNILLLSIQILIMSIVISSCATHIRGLRTVKAHCIKEQYVRHYMPVAHIKTVELSANYNVGLKNTFNKQMIDARKMYGLPPMATNNAFVNTSTTIKQKNINEAPPVFVKHKLQSKKRSYIINSSVYLILGSILLFIDSLLIIAPFNVMATMILVTGVIFLFSLFLIIRGCFLQKVQNPHGLSSMQIALRALAIYYIVAFLLMALCYGILLYLLSTSNLFGDVLGGVM